MIDQGEIRFVEKTHEYFLGERRLPSVTQVLESGGYINGDYFTEASRIRGKAVHIATALLDDKRLDWDSVQPKELGYNILGYLEGYERFLKESEFKADLKEQVVYDELWGYAGTLDKTGTLPNYDGPIIVEEKSGKLEPWTALQAAAYEACLPQRHFRLGLELSKEGRYRIFRFKNTNDIQVFRASVAGVNWKRNQK